MRLGQVIGATQKDIESKKFNYWIGVSLGYKYFNKDNIQTYIEWAISNTKNSIFILVADWIYAINLEVLDKRDKQLALRKAMRLGDAKIAEITDIINALAPEVANRIKIGRWKDIESSEIHQNRVKILFEEFKKKTDFYNRIIEIVKDTFKNNPKNVTQEDLEKLAEYVLHEMPVFLDGIHLFGNTYDATLYPKIGLIDLLEKDLQEGVVFPEITKRLEIKSPAAIIEAYVD
ncbi:MAG: tRNA-dependent cyclodipeptide synthase [Patescibacteria group bacterium]